MLNSRIVHPAIEAPCASSVGGGGSGLRWACLGSAAVSTSPETANPQCGQFSGPRGNCPWQDGQTATAITIPLFVPDDAAVQARCIVHHCKRGRSDYPGAGHQPLAGLRPVHCGLPARLRPAALVSASPLEIGKDFSWFSGASCVGALALCGTAIKHNVRASASFALTLV